MNIVIVGLSKKQQDLFYLLNNPDAHQVTAFKNGKLAMEEIKRSANTVDWIVVADFSENTFNKELLCGMRSMGICPEVLVVNDSFSVNATRPALCSVQQTDSGSKLLKCAMHSMLAQDRQDQEKRKEARTSHSSMMVFEYQGKKSIKH